MNADATRRLRLVYAELDGGIASLLRDSGGACRSCGMCCTFPPGSPVLYATALEREFLASVPPGEQACLPGRACPYLHVETKRCSARERRTIGCRAHFCAEAVGHERAREAASELGERALAEVRRIVSAHGLEWDYAPVVARLAGRWERRAGSP